MLRRSFSSPGTCAGKYAVLTLSAVSLIAAAGPSCELLSKTDDGTTSGGAQNSNSTGQLGDGQSGGDEGGGGGSPETGTPPPSLAGLQVFPADNAWNTDISNYPLHPNSANFIASIGNDIGLHPDFGTVWDGAPIGIPYTVVENMPLSVPVTFDYADESDPGPYPIPQDAAIEGGPDSDGDRHILIVDVGTHRLYELFYAFPKYGTDPAHASNGVQQITSWTAGSGAIFNLDSNALRPAGWTSADAAGLPIFPGLVRYDETVQQGEIKHALRFTVQHTQRGYINPARHFASNLTDSNLPPMGLRVRLKANFSISGFSPRVQVILRAMKRYGMFVADNGSNWYVSGAPDARWDDDELHQLGNVHGRDFEVVNTGPIVTH